MTTKGGKVFLFFDEDVVPKKGTRTVSFKRRLAFQVEINLHQPLEVGIARTVAFEVRAPRRIPLEVR